MTTLKLELWPGEMAPCACGRSYLILVNSFGVYRVFCEGCKEAGPKAVSEDAAIAAWNRRAADDKGKK